MNALTVQNNASQKAIITLGPHCLGEVDASFEPVLRDALSYEHVDFVNQANRLEYPRSRKRVYCVTGSNRLEFPIGCLQRVSRVLREAGHACKIHDHRELSDSLRVDTADFDVADRACKGITDCVKQHAEGLLRIERGRPRARAIGAICRLLPKARIFVAGSSRQVLQETAAELGHFVGGEVEVVRGGNWSSGCRVVCGTFTSFDRAQASDWDVLIFEDGFEALGKRTHQTRGSFGRHRVYAFIPPNGRLTRKQELELEVLAGPTIHAANRRKRRSELELEVVFASAPSEHLPRLNTTRERREQLWNAPRRNSAVAAVADALATRNPVPLWEHGLFLHDDEPFCRWGQQPSVTVLVESARHADALARLLPGWTIMNRRPHHAGLASPSDAWSRWAVPDRSIVTAVRANEYRTFNASVIVSAAGGYASQLPAGLARCSGHVLVVDFDDAGDHFQSSDTESRRQSYRKLLQSERVS